MDSKNFKSLFNAEALKHGFQFKFGGWFKQSSECILILTLQKSSYSNLYHLNIKIYVNGMVETMHVNNKELTQKLPGNLFRRQPKEFDEIFDLDLPMTDDKREQGLELFFTEYMVPFSEKALTLEGLKKLWKDNQLFFTAADKRFFSLPL